MLENLSFHYWFMFPLGIVIASIASSSGFSGGVLYQPIYNIFLELPIANSVATGIATETIGMTSAAIRYLLYKTIELPIGFTMIMLAIPGAVVGNHILMIINGNILKLVLGGVLLGLASIQLYSALRQRFGHRKSVPIEDIYPFMLIPPISGVFSATTGSGVCEMSQPLLEKGLDLDTKRANATAILVEAVCDWTLTILNLHAGFIMLEIIMFTVPAVIIGGQLGAYISKYLPVRLTKTVFSLAVASIAIFYIYAGIRWIIET
jgi:uncharacterized membrane protein YfcA